MNHVEVECTNVFNTEGTELSREEKRALFTQKWMEFINQKEQQE